MISVMLYSASRFCNRDTHIFRGYVGDVRKHSSQNISELSLKECVSVPYNSSQSDGGGSGGGGDGGGMEKQEDEINKDEYQ